MRFPGLSIVLVLAACNSGSDGAATPGAGEQAAAPAASWTPGSETVSTADVAAALLDSLSKPQQKGRYAPRDDCSKLPGAAEFRRKLAEAVLKHNAEGVAVLASPDVKLGFAGDDGRERFLENLKEPKGDLIGELQRLLALGCAANAEGGLTIPWHFAQDFGDIDGYSAMIVTGEDVPLYSAADDKSPVRQRLSWDVVEIFAGLYPERKFQQVRARDGSEGYMPTAKLRSLLDYRLLAMREGGEWRIGAIVAGD